jgi:hypothetical protein
MENGIAAAPESVRAETQSRIKGLTEYQQAVR